MKRLLNSLFLVLLVTALPCFAQPAKVPSALAALAKSEDKIEGITWYTSRSSPTSQNANAVLIYMGVKAGAPWLRLKMQYAADDWLFIQTATVVVDGVKRGLIAGKWLRDHSGGKIWEWSDTSVEPNQVAMIAAMSTAKSVTIRYDGAKYKADRTLKPQELAAMRQVLKAYAELGGAVR